MVGVLLIKCGRALRISYFLSSLYKIDIKRPHICYMWSDSLLTFKGILVYLSFTFNKRYNF